MTQWQVLVVLGSVAMLPWMGGCDTAAIGEKNDIIEAPVADTPDGKAIHAVSVRVVAPGDECPEGGARLIGDDGTEAFVCNGAPGTAPSTASLPPGHAHCTWGGIAITSAGETAYLCNGASGADGASVSVTTLSPGHATCGEGGIAVAAADGTTYICNGARGEAGADGNDGTSVTATALSQGDPNCANGGVAVTSALNTSYVCNGSDGEAGASVTTATVSAGAFCTNGGVAIWSGGTASYVCNGRNGTNGTNGTNGSNGSNGTSVTSTALGVGDADCPYGGSRFQSASGTTYACNGAPGDSSELPPLAAAWPVSVRVDGVEVGTFQHFSGIGSYNEIIVVKSVDAKGNPIIQKVPGDLRFKTLKLRQGLADTAYFSDWRAAVVSGAPDMRREVVLAFFNERAEEVARFSLAHAWPSTLQFAYGPTANGASASGVAELHIEYESAAMAASGHIAPAPGTLAVLDDGLGMTLYPTKLSGLGTSSEVIEHKVVGGDGSTTITKIPGDLSVGDLTANAAFSGTTSLWDWRASVQSTHPDYLKSLNLVLYDETWLPTGEWSLRNAWPSEYEFAVGPGGILEERFTIVTDESTRVR